MSNSSHPEKKHRPDHGRGGNSYQGQHRRGSRRRRKTPTPPPKADEASIASVRAKLSDAEYVVFDIETTGGNPEKNGITEIFAVKYKDGVPGGTFYSLVNPKIPIPPIVRRMTGINNQMVREAPTIDAVMPGFVEFIGNDILVSHNTIGDMKFIRYFAKEVCGNEVQNFFLCTHLLVEKLAKEAPDKSLRGLAEYFKLASGDLHRAEADAYVTLELFKVLLGRLVERRITLVEEAIRLQGDLDSGVRLGWGIPPARLENIPQQPGVFQMLDLDRKVLFASSCHHLDREIRKIRLLDQLPRGLLRVALKSYDLKCDPYPSLFAAMLAEGELMHRQAMAYDPYSWHQRVIFGILFSRGPEGIKVSVGTMEDGVVLAIGPVRDRRQASEYLDGIAQAFGRESAKDLVMSEQDFTTIRASLEGNLSTLIASEKKRRGSIGMWFRPSSRRSVDKKIATLEALAKVPALLRAESMLENSGVLAIPEGKTNTSWQIYPIYRGRPLAAFPLKGDLEPRLRDPKVLGQIRERLSVAQANGAVKDEEAFRINATLWMIYNGRNEGRFVSLAELESLP